MAATEDKNMAKKTFNAVAKGLFTQIALIFPGDPKLLLLSRELMRMSRSKGESHVPAMKFFKALNAPSGVKSAAATGEIAPVGELILNRDDRLFTTAEASVPDLDAVDFKGKWPKLTPKNQIEVWDYLERMATLAAKVATLEVLKPEDMAELCRLRTEGTPQDVKSLMANPAILELSEKIGARMVSYP
jgi:hypothetical protein